MFPCLIALRGVTQVLYDGWQYGPKYVQQRKLLSMEQRLDLSPLPKVLEARSLKVCQIEPPHMNGSR